MIALSSTQVRKEWSTVIDDVVRVHPVLVKRTHDEIMLTNIETLRDILDIYKFTAVKYTEDDGSITLSLNELDLVENAPTLKEAKEAMGNAIVEYATEFYDDYLVWSTAPNRKSHIPYIYKALLAENSKRIGEEIECRAGKN